MTVQFLEIAEEITIEALELIEAIEDAIETDSIYFA